MITLALLNKMVEDHVGGLVKNKDFFWEEMPLHKDGKPASGVWIVTRTSSNNSGRNGHNLKTTADFYVAFANKAKTEVVHKAIRDYITTHLCFCELSGSIDGTDYTYSFTNVRMRGMTTPQVDGITENGLIVKLASVELVYDENINQ